MREEYRRAGFQIRALLDISSIVKRVENMSLVKKMKLLRFRTQSKFERQLDRNGFKRISVIGDGRCLFRAVSKGIARAAMRKMSEREERQDADRLRMLAWKAVSFTRRAEFTKACVVEGDYDQYIADSRSSSFYGGYPELMAMVDLLGRCIQVYTINENDLSLIPIEEFGTCYKDSYKSLGRKDDGIIRVLLFREHYDLLIPKG